MFVSCMTFVCCENDISASEVRTGLKWPTKRDTSKSKATTNDIIATEMKSIKELITSIKNATDANTAEIAAIKSLSTQTDANVKKVTEQNGVMNQMQTPLAPGMKYIQEHRARSYAKAVSATPTGAKRKRLQSPAREKVQFPPAKIGKKSNVNGLSVVPKMNHVNDVPKFAKALYVSRLNPVTTIEELSDYIIGNTPITDATKFKVHKMVKKGIDESTLKYVSFKVELNVEELEVLDDVDLWPQGVHVREFSSVPKNTLGNYFPSLNATKTTATTNPADLMDML